jgi:hypothetical protein
MRHSVRRVRACPSRVGGAAPAPFLSVLSAFVFVLSVVAVFAGPAAPAARAAETAQASSSPVVGAWWRRLPASGGAGALQVWDLRPDGSFVTFAPEALQDRGRYRVGSGTIHVASELNPALKGDLRYRLRGKNAMTITIGPPLNQVQAWARVTWPENFDLADVGGHPVPSGIDQMVTRMVAASRARWRPDALPERLELRAMKNRDMQATLDICSPKDGACQRLRITRYKVDISQYQTPPGRRIGFPAKFMDLARAAGTARGLGHDGRLARARIGLGSPHWGLTFTGGSKGKASVVLDGVTGKRVVHDMNVVMADYNRQWDEAIAGLQRRFGSVKPGSNTDDCGPFMRKDKDSGRCFDGDLEDKCSRSGGLWQYGSCRN